MRARRRRVLGGVLLGVAAAIMAALAFGLAMYSHMGSSADNIEANPEQADVPPENPVDWAYWLGVNPDIVGWIRVPGTSVDHPIVQAHADDPQHYLSHDAYGEWNIFGCPYIDAGCVGGLSSLNVVIYGHNMGDGSSMFGELENYHGHDWASEHQTVFIYTPNRALELSVIGSDTIGGWEDAKRTSFAGMVDFEEYRSQLLSACDVTLPAAGPSGSVIKDDGLGTGGSAVAGADDVKQLFTLCTCSYFMNPANERTLVYCEQVDFVEFAVSAA